MKPNKTINIMIQFLAKSLAKLQRESYYYQVKSAAINLLFIYLFNSSNLL